LAFWYSRRWSGGWEERPPDPEIKVGHGFSLAAELPLGVARLRDDTDLKSAGGKTTGGKETPAYFGTTQAGLVPGKQGRERWRLNKPFRECLPRPEATGGLSEVAATPDPTEMRTCWL